MFDLPYSYGTCCDRHVFCPVRKLKTAWKAGYTLGGHVWLAIFSNSVWNMSRKAHTHIEPDEQSETVTVY